MQILLPAVLPGGWFASLMSLFKLDHPLLALSLSPLGVVGMLALWYYLRLAAKEAAAVSTHPVPRFLYALAGFGFLALAVVLAPLSYAQSHAGGNAAISVTLGFLAFYCAIATVLCLGRAVVRGPRRLAFWVFLPRWLQDAEGSEMKTHAERQPDQQP